MQKVCYGISGLDDEGGWHDHLMTYIIYLSRRTLKVCYKIKYNIKACEAVMSYSYILNNANVYFIYLKQNNYHDICLTFLFLLF